MVKAKLLRKGSFKKLFNKTRAEIVQDHGNGLVTVNIGGRWAVVKRSNLK